MPASLNPSEFLAGAVSLLERGIAEGLHLGAQLYVSLQGKVLADQAVGQARAGVPMRSDTIVLWLSAVKPLTAVAVAQLWEKGRLDLDDAVAKHLPRFAQAAKDRITVRHLLTHTGGFRTADKCDLGASWDDIIECICQTPAEPRSVPGARAGYHISSSWYLLGELVHRLDGRPFETYLKEEILRPCGLEETSVGMPIPDSRRYGDRLGVMYHTEKAPASPHHRWNDETDAAVCRPGRNGRGPIRELGRFYEELLQVWQDSDSSPNRLALRRETLLEMTRRQRAGMFDDTFQHIIDWGLGFCLDSKRYGRETVPYGYGRFCSEKTFGHSGAQSSCAFADPEHGLVVAWACNGMPGERRHQQRARDLNSAIYEDLKLQ